MCCLRNFSRANILDEYLLSKVDFKYLIVVVVCSLVNAWFIVLVVSKN